MDLSALVFTLKYRIECCNEVHIDFSTGFHIEVEVEEEVELEAVENARVVVEEDIFKSLGFCLKNPYMDHLCNHPYTYSFPRTSPFLAVDFFILLVVSEFLSLQINYPTGSY
jgi:hypothetical protein